MIKYGSAPKEIGRFYPEVGEMMFYLYLPVTIPGWGTYPRLPKRLEIYRELIKAASDDYCTLPDCESEPLVYLTAKTMFVTPEQPGNRPGWHCDGFGSGGDINYIWCDKNPTEFLIGNDFEIGTDDAKSMRQMEELAMGQVRTIYKPNTLLRLDEGVIHQVGRVLETGVRSFVKVTFSRHRFAKKGNSHNHLFDYDWDMGERSTERNLDHGTLTKEMAIG